MELIFKPPDLFLFSFFFKIHMPIVYTAEDIHFPSSLRYVDDITLMAEREKKLYKESLDMGEKRK